MYNVRRKLWILTVLIFAVSAVMLKFFPSSDNNDAIATPASAQQAESGTSTVFSGGSTDIRHRMVRRTMRAKLGQSAFQKQQTRFKEGKRDVDVGT